MKVFTGLNMLFAIWLLLWVCPAYGDTNAVSIMDHSMARPSSSHQSTNAALNTTVTGINNASFVAGVPSISSTRCLNSTVNATMLAVPSRQPENGDLTSSVELANVVSHSQNSTSISCFDVLLDDKPALNASDASLTNLTHSSGPEGSAIEAVEGGAKNMLAASLISSQTIQALPRCGNTSAPIESQVLSAPNLIPDPTAIPSDPTSKISASIIPRAEEVTPAPATHKSLIIGVVFGTFFGSLLIICVAAACCTSQVRQKTWFWRRREDRVRDGPQRCATCNGPATTLGLGNGISNASSDTLFEAYGVRPGQYPRNVRLSGRNTQRGRRDSDSYELQDLRALAGYSTGGYLSAV